MNSIEAFDDDPLMGKLRRAFTEEHALQCGYCTPGMLIAARDLIRRNTGLSRDEIRVEMSGNLCRCTGYIGIISAISRVMAEHDAGASPEQAAASWLGPAPGPAAVGPAAVSSMDSVAKTAVAARPSTAVPRRPASGARRIKVSVSALGEVDGATRLSQSFHLAHPRDAVWQLIKEPEAVAACMPGMFLDSQPRDDRVKGRMSVKLGPISADFAGEATIQRMERDYRQVIEGRGGDKSGSRVSGTIDYRLSEETMPESDPGTRVDVTISYVLTGALAQFGRSGLVRDLAARIGETFAQNLEHRLSAPGSRPMVTSSLNVLSLGWNVLLGRLKSALAWMWKGKR